MERQRFSPVKSIINKGGLLWLPFLALLILVVSFEIVPAVSIILKSFCNESGITFGSYLEAFSRKFYRQSLLNSVIISVSSALIGLLIGTITALCLRSSKSEISERIVTVINITSNFSGVPLAFAFIVLLGSNGIFTVFLKNVMGFDIYNSGFNLYSWAGITMVYVYFQIPMAIMLMYPAIYAIKDDVMEAAFVLGANRFVFWEKIGIPVLLPPLSGSFCILFANALGAYATAYALVNANKSLISITVANLVSGDVSADPSLASALAVIMGIILMVSLFISNKFFKKYK